MSTRVSKYSVSASYLVMALSLGTFLIFLNRGGFTLEKHTLLTEISLSYLICLMHLLYSLLMYPSSPSSSVGSGLLNIKPLVRVKRAFTGFFIGTLVFYFIFILYGAPIFKYDLTTRCATLLSSHNYSNFSTNTNIGMSLFRSFFKTLFFAHLISAMTSVPSSILLGCHPQNWKELFFTPIHNTMFETCCTITVVFSILGAWVGGFAIPLDWDRPWQVWPISCVYGSLLGHILGLLICSIYCLFFKEKKNIICLTTIEKKQLKPPKKSKRTLSTGDSKSPASHSHTIIHNNSISSISPQDLSPPQPNTTFYHHNNNNLHNHHQNNNIYSSSLLHNEIITEEKFSCTGDIIFDYDSINTSNNNNNNCIENNNKQQQQQQDEIMTSYSSNSKSNSSLSIHSTNSNNIVMSSSTTTTVVASRLSNPQEIMICENCNHCMTPASKLQLHFTQHNLLSSQAQSTSSSPSSVTSAQHHHQQQQLKLNLANSTCSINNNNNNNISNINSNNSNHNTPNLGVDEDDDEDDTIINSHHHQSSLLSLPNMNSSSNSINTTNSSLTSSTNPIPPFLSISSPSIVTPQQRQQQQQLLNSSLGSTPNNNSNNNSSNCPNHINNNNNTPNNQITNTISFSPPTTPRTFYPKETSYDTKDTFTITVSNSELNSMISDNSSTASISSFHNRSSTIVPTYKRSILSNKENSNGSSNESLHCSASSISTLRKYDYTKDITFLHNDNPDSIKEKSTVSNASSISSASNIRQSHRDQRPRGRSISDSLFMSQNNKDSINDIQRAIESEKIKKNRFEELKNILGERDDIIEINELQFVQKVGEGAFSEVWEGWWKGIHVAIKKLKIIGDEEQFRERFIREVQNLKNANHQNIVMFMGACYRPACIITEFMSGGSLYNVLHNPSLPKKKYSFPLLLKMATDIALGLLHLHSKSIVHRDLTSQNILLDELGNLKVSDFGLSREKPREGSMTMTNGGICNPRWRPPEITKNLGHYSEKVDVYCFSLVVWELLTGEIPFSDLDGSQASAQVAYAGLRPPFPDHCDPELKKLLIQCWETEPENRPLFPYIVQKLKDIAWNNPIGFVSEQQSEPTTPRSQNTTPQKMY
eukprot:gene3169-3968_t